MKYVKAQSVFPVSLLREMQKYVQGELVYIPKHQANYKKWGTGTGARDMFAQRNESMLRAYKAGISIAELAEVYGLSEDTVKKIVYRKR